MTFVNFPKWSWTLLLYITASTENITFGFIWENLSRTPYENKNTNAEQFSMEVALLGNIHQLIKYQKWLLKEMLNSTATHFSMAYLMGL